MLQLSKQMRSEWVYNYWLSSSNLAKVSRLLSEGGERVLSPKRCFKEKQDNGQYLKIQ
jgi:hypothetical protein